MWGPCTKRSSFHAYFRKFTTKGSLCHDILAITFDSKFGLRQSRWGWKEDSNLYKFIFHGFFPIRTILKSKIESNVEQIWNNMNAENLEIFWHLSLFHYKRGVPMHEIITYSPLFSRFRVLIFYFHGFCYEDDELKARPRLEVKFNHL